MSGRPGVSILTSGNLLLLTGVLLLRLEYLLVTLPRYRFSTSPGSSGVLHHENEF